MKLMKKYISLMLVLMVNLKIYEGIEYGDERPF